MSSIALLRLFVLAVACTLRLVPLLVVAGFAPARFVVFACGLKSGLFACWARPLRLLRLLPFLVLLALLAFRACQLLLHAGLQFPSVRLGVEPRFGSCCAGVMVPSRPSSGSGLL